MGTTDPTPRIQSRHLRMSQFGRWVIEALRHLDDFGYLQTHPLSRYVASASTTKTGEALHHAITSAIEELRSSSAANERALRGIEVLYWSCTHGLHRDEVQERLLISRSEYHRAQARGQNALILSLAERWGASVNGVSSNTTIAVGALIPSAMDKFVGRASDLAEIERLLLQEATIRLVTILGAPGCGKTRLAFEAARRLKTEFPDGVFCVQLAAINSPEAVPDAIVAALGLSESRDMTSQQCLAAFFRERESLLVLDNLEHLPGAARFIASLLSTCPSLKVLATSRSVLRLTGEQSYPLSTLAVPQQDCSELAGEPSLRILKGYEAVELFVERARAADRRFTLNPRNAKAICLVCGQLDGLPLAIELVAARTRSLSVQAILERLNHRLDLAAGRDADRPLRQRSLRTAIAWSYELLDDDARRLFRCLGIFDGACSLEAIEAIAGFHPILDALDELIAQSLVRRWEGEDGQPYFEMLVTIREFALEALEATGEREGVEGRFITYCCGLAGQGVHGLRGPQQVAWANRLAIESPNLTKSIALLMERDPKEALYFVANLGSFWIYRSQLSVGREWSEQVLKLSVDDSLGRARVRFNAAVIARDQGEVDIAQRYLETSFKEFQALNDNRGQALSLHFLGLLAHQRGDHPLAIRQLKESKRIFGLIEYLWGVGWTLHALGTVYEQQRKLFRARILYKRSHAILSEISDVRGTAVALSSLGSVQRLLGRVDESRMSLEEALRLQRRIGYRSGSEITLLSLSGLAHLAGDFEAAYRLIDEATQIATQIGDRRNLRTALAHRLVVLKSEGRFSEAMRLAEEVLAMCREQSDIPWLAMMLATVGDLVGRTNKRDAVSYFRQSLQMMSIFKNRWATARTIALIGLWAARHERLRDAIRALGAAEGVQVDIKASIEYSCSAELVELESRARAELGMIDTAAYFAEGKAMSFSQAIAFVQSLLDCFNPPSESSVPGSPYSAGTKSG